VTSVFDPLAKREYEDAVEYYEAQEAGLGDTFRGAVLSAIAILERFRRSVKRFGQGSVRSSCVGFPTS
jgi:hypothetical protein